ncbi:hypothetical protein [Okeania sp. KiyG1]|uniref:hypothetical protein n=1 Tax=Okeania sp. KiyG1 TaxID=2720165 RepID=UPI0019229BC2|nr:hypothetical protein [Okeania sp. KiyG1]GGA59301.1 hypothetical protein CYANOKiyG1_80760 [Okeania sp. KiyG1]
MGGWGMGDGLKVGKIYTNRLNNCQKKTLNLGKYLTVEVELKYSINDKWSRQDACTKISRNGNGQDAHSTRLHKTIGYNALILYDEIGTTEFCFVG